MHISSSRDTAPKRAAGCRLWTRGGKPAHASIQTPASSGKGSGSRCLSQVSPSTLLPKQPEGRLLVTPWKRIKGEPRQCKPFCCSCQQCRFCLRLFASPSHGCRQHATKGPGASCARSQPVRKCVHPANAKFGSRRSLYRLRIPQCHSEHTTCRVFPTPHAGGRCV